MYSFLAISPVLKSVLHVSCHILFLRKQEHIILCFVFLQKLDQASLCVAPKALDKKNTTGFWTAGVEAFFCAI